MRERVRKELRECAAGLLALNLSSSEDEINLLIGDGYFHLNELKRSCNTTLRSALAQRVERAEYLLEQKLKQEAAR